MGGQGARRIIILAALMISSTRELIQTFRKSEQDNLSSHLHSSVKEFLCQTCWSISIDYMQQDCVIQ